MSAEFHQAITLNEIGVQLLKIEEKMPTLRERIAMDLLTRRPGLSVGSAVSLADALIDELRATRQRQEFNSPALGAAMDQFEAGERDRKPKEDV